MSWKKEYKNYISESQYKDYINLKKLYKDSEEKIEALEQENKKLSEQLHWQIESNIKRQTYFNDESVGTQNYTESVDVLKKWIIINEKEALYWKEKYLDRWMLEDAIESSKIKEKKHE